MTEAQLALIMACKGWCDSEKALAICKWVGVLCRTGPVRGVEIGVLGGRTLFAAALGIKNSGGTGHIVGIDAYDWDACQEGEHHPPPPQEISTWDSREGLLQVLPQCLTAIRALGVEHYCSVLNARSQDVCGLIGELDYLHIDGNHSTEVAMRDLESYLPLVRSGGIVILDDTDFVSLQPVRKELGSRCRRMLHCCRRGHHEHACDYEIWEN